ncbi:hypothetical protein AB0J86_10395 [Micromonospora sp. NPDC049559]|uniref:hypothetical protein n=1 Tax=Micromonospora sp. NPDC049559 TaxID=3155923 RepID=UPI0034346D3E
MNVSKRDRWDRTGGERDAGQRTPRSGGRIAGARATRAGVVESVPVRGGRANQARARGAREFPTQGSTALRPQDWVAPAERDRARESARAAHPAGGAAVARENARAAHPAGSGAGAPRLKVAPPPPVAVPGAPFVGLILAVVVGGVLGILLVNTKINENAFRLDKLQKQQASLDIQQQQLEKQIAESEAPGNLAARARALGLVESGPPAFIRLPDGKVIGIPQPAGGEPAITSQQGTGQQGAGR